MTRLNQPDGCGLYVHIPFCRQLCPYCDFAVAVRREPPHEAYCDALIAEWGARRAELPGEIATVYFGGGTPGMWTIEALRRFLDSVTHDATEVTIEANPHDITADRLSQWRELGINRVSLGVQSFDDAALAGLGRDHDGRTAERAVKLLVEHGDFRCSMDLIYGGPEYSAEILEADVERAAALGPHHVSAYQLTVEQDTVFGRRQRRGELHIAGEDDVADLGIAMERALAKHGFQRYEVSSYGRADDRAQHNSGYWLGRPYVGLGVGAHSMQRIEAGVRRRRNVRSLNVYLADPLTADEIEEVSAEDHLAERLFLAGRTTLGVAWSELRRRFVDVESSIWDRVAAAHSEMRGLGWLEDSDEALTATPRGLDVADAIAERFWDATRMR